MTGGSKKSSFIRNTALIEAVGNSQISQTLVAQSASRIGAVTQAIRHASAQSGVDFSYLLNNASQESGLNPSAKASTSSATGLFQFVEQTWLRMVKLYGDKYGLTDAAANIKIGSDGVARVADSTTKKEILALRQNAQVSACMAAELTNANKEALECKTGKKVDSTDLYLAHFLGAAGAAEFINTMRANPNAAAADVLPEAAAANSSVFYGKDGQPKTLAQVYQRFAQKFSQTPDVVTKNTSTAPSAVRTARLAMVAAPTSADSNDTSISLASLPSTFSTIRRDAAVTSPFATMMLAQMDAGALTLPTSGSAVASENDEEKKRFAALIAGRV